MRWLQVSKFFNDVVTKKTDLNTFQDSGGKRKQQINAKDNFWPVRVVLVLVWEKITAKKVICTTRLIWTFFSTGDSANESLTGKLAEGFGRKQASDHSVEKGE